MPLPVFALVAINTTTPTTPTTTTTTVTTIIDSAIIDSNNNNNIELFQDYSDELLTFAWVACIVFIIVGVPGNLLTIVALSRGKQTRNSTAIFIINLSCSDLLFGCFNLPLAASTFMKRAWTHSDLLCRLFPLLRYGLLAVSLFTVSLITINRYIIIAHPRQYLRIYQRRYLAMMVAGTWILAFSIMIPTWRGIWGRFGLDQEIGSCSILHDKYDRSPKEFLFVLAFMVPCICIVICYARIFHLVRKAAIRTRETAQKNMERATTPLATAPSSPAPTSPTTPTTPTAPTTPISPKPKSPILQINNTTLSFIGKGESIEFIDENASVDSLPISYKIKQKPKLKPLQTQTISDTTLDATQAATSVGNNHQPPQQQQQLQNTYKSTPTSTATTTTSPIISTSFTRFTPRKMHYVSIGNNTSNASSSYPGRMSPKDRRLLKMILVIFVWFVICYLPITIAKIWKGATEKHVFNISGYLLIYLTTCINPLIYVLMSSEYRRAYWNLLRCRQSEQQQQHQHNQQHKKKQQQRQQQHQQQQQLETQQQRAS